MQDSVVTDERSCKQTLKVLWDSFVFRLYCLDRNKLFFFLRSYFPLSLSLVSVPAVNSCKKRQRLCHFSFPLKIEAESMAYGRRLHVHVWCRCKMSCLFYTRNWWVSRLFSKRRPKITVMCGTRRETQKFSKNNKTKVQTERKNIKIQAFFRVFSLEPKAKWKL